jgi:Putative zinc- or iron-chelating domain
MFSGDELIPRLEALFRDIDATYSETADQVGFSCEGCDGAKCCTVDLTLHTFSEMYLLRRGFNSLASERRQAIIDRSEIMVEAKSRDLLGDAYRNGVCVLNFGGSCSLYHHRPMICRLAGIRHFIVKPDGRITGGDGCPTFKEVIQPVHPDLQIDRTPFYQAMAKVEIVAVHALGSRIAPRTIAEIMVRPEDRWAVPLSA